MKRFNIQKFEDRLPYMAAIILSLYILGILLKLWLSLPFLWIILFIMYKDSVKIVKSKIKAESI